LQEKFYKFWFLQAFVIKAGPLGGGPVKQVLDVDQSRPVHLGFELLQTAGAEDLKWKMGSELTIDTRRKQHPRDLDNWRLGLINLEPQAQGPFCTSFMNG
jgi:hypothetical protein